MTNNQLTKEWLQQTIAELESVRDEIPFGIDTNSELELAAFKLALTAMDSEPVAYAWVSRSGKKHLTRCEPEQWRDAVILTPLYRHAQPAPERDQVRSEHAEWSQATFGNVGPVGPLKHLSKEALEAAAEPGDLSEWADMQFLLWDAQRRAGITDEQITQAMIEKLVVNKQREWPEPKDGEPRLHIKAQPAQVTEREPIAWLNDAYLARGVVDGEAGSEDAGPGYIPVYREAQPAPTIQVTDAMAYAFHHALTDGPLGDEDVEDIKTGLRASFATVTIKQPEPVVPVEATIDNKPNSSYEWRKGWNACRAAMLQDEPVTTANKLGNSPVIPDGYVMVPMRLTAENGAKGALSGEFSETKFVNCPECFGDDECETCDGSGRIEITVPVTWTTIKEIWAKGVEHFAPASTEE